MPNTPEEIALARRIVATFYQGIRDHDYARWVLNGEKDGDNLMRIALAAIVEATEQVAKLADTLMGVKQPSVFGNALRAGEHLKNG